MPPPSSQAGAKRKRNASVFSTSRLPRDSINPLSHPPSTLRQFALAGLPETELLPSDLVPNFPHRPLPADAGQGEVSEARDSAGTEADGDDDEDDEGGEDSDEEHDQGDGRRRGATGPTHALKVLTAILHRSLEEGDIPRAKRAFGLLLRTRQRGKPLDPRQNGYWALGAEILMRDGETTAAAAAAAAAREGRGQEQRTAAARWGSAANMGQVRTYFQELIQQYPYNRWWPQSTSALDFWPALLGCEFYNVHTEYGLALRRLAEEAEEEDWDEGSDRDYQSYAEAGGDGDGDGAGPWRDPRQERLREERDRLRLQALEMMRDVAARMDNLMHDPPYSTSHEMLRLRGMVALYAGDLAAPPARRSAAEKDSARQRRGDEWAQAEVKFRRIIRHGGEVDDWIRRFLRLDSLDDDDDDDEQEDEGADGDQDDGAARYSSLPIRNP